MQALNLAGPPGRGGRGDFRMTATTSRTSGPGCWTCCCWTIRTAYESEGYSWEEVGSDRLLHVRKGEDYASFRYGPQRLGFLSLDAERRPYRVVRTYSSLGALIRSGHSHFVSEGLLVRKGYRPRGDEPSIPYAILCLYRPTPGAEEVLRALRPNTVI